ncbi:hemagglutinin repeat-containing protein [Rhizobium sp. BK538]|uniref:hemagglutinin repeat-containing protein n=1 Tax=Rhizobium sp. BK538 TaxID=2586984 RepID=UPI0017ED9343|nr:hemagglutinin repeat-containing protein [Rhizobium sp. BK538]MBB4170808.1 filamentous hemagglutinin [Rhizobium sp. BK538]
MTRAFKRSLSDVSGRKASSVLAGTFARKLLASGLSVVIAFQPVLLRAQEIAPDVGAAAINRPGVGTAPNGMPLIDIVTPNGQGLSHNKYNSFNVGTQGLILNNFNGEVGTSKLGGITPGNPNLQGKSPASVILNEVTSQNRSSLLGPTEVFGGRADVIIANPNGITCDGCGFINTPRATLTTGVPDIGADGRLNGFTVRGGDVTFGSKGANLAAGDGAVDLFDIVSRTIKVDGPVYGKDLRLTAGASKFNYATGEATALEATSGTPEYAIDGSALGAMQAGRIKMVVTEKGAGVRMRGDMAANAGELSLSSDGKISIGNASGSQGVTIKSGSSVQANKLTSKARVSVQANRGITLQTVAADGDVVLGGGSGLLSVAGDVSALGAIQVSSAGVSIGNLDAGDLIDLASSSGTVAIGDARSRGALTISAVSGAITANSLLSYDNISLTAGSNLTVAGNVTAAGIITADASAVSARAVTSGVDIAATAASPGGKVVFASAGDLNLRARSGSVVATSLGSAGQIQATANLVQAGTITSHGAIDLHGDLDVSGQVLGGSDVAISGNTIKAGAIVSGVDFAATAQSASGSIILAATGDLRLTATNDIDVDSVLSARRIDITAEMLRGQSISGRQGIALNTGVNLSGQVLGGSDVTISGKSIRAAAVASGVDFDATAQSASGDVVLGNAGDMTLTASSDDIAIATMLSAGDLKATATDDISGKAVSHGALTLDAGDAITLSGQSLSGSSVKLTADSINVDTLISGVDFAGTSAAAAGNVLLGVNGTLSVEATQGSVASNYLISAGDLTAKASQNLSYQSLQSNADATLSADTGTISLDKTTRAAGDISVKETSVDLSNGRSGLATSGTLTVNADTANFSGSTLTFGGLNAKLKGTANVTNAMINTVTKSGGTGDLSIEASSVTTSGSTALLAGHNLNLALADFTNAGQIAAKNDLNVTVTGNLTNSPTGLIYAGGDAKVFVAGNLTNNQGAILVGDDLAIAGEAATQRNHALTNISGMIRAGGDLSILTDNLTNQRLTTPTWSNVLVSSGVASGFTLNPGVAGLPFAYMESEEQNMFQLYPGIDAPQFSDYQPLLWSVATLSDGTSYHAWTWISGNGPTAVGPIFNWIRDRVPKDANGNPILDPNNPSRYFIVDQVVHGGVPDYSTTYTWDYSANLSQSVYEDRFTSALTPEALIHAGGNLTVDATTATNEYSTIEAEFNATFKGDKLTNKGMSLNRTTTTTCNAQGGCEAYDAAGNRNPSKNIANGTSIVSKVESIGGASAIVRAGGALDTSRVDLDNIGAASSAQGASVVRPTRLDDPTDVLSSMTSGSALFTVNAAIAGLSGNAGVATRSALTAALPNGLPNPKSGGFDGDVPGLSFLYETRAAYLDVGTFYGSGYFANKIGYKPDRDVPFLGDAYFENQFIDQQLRQLAGQGLGSHSFVPGSDAIEQVKELLDQGVDFAKSHKLAVGQVLSPEQVAALTEPLVWYEKKLVNGIEVLVPVVYIPSTEMAELTASGALMAGDSVTIKGASINNSGTMLAKNDLSVSGTSIGANGGSFKAGGNVSLISSGALTLSAQSLDLGGQTLVVPGASVLAGGDANLSAVSDLTLKGASVSAGANTTLSGQTVTLDVAKAENGGQENVTGSSVSSGGNLTISADDNVNVIGSAAKAGKALSVTADKGSVNVVSAGLAHETSDGYTTTTSTDQQQSQLSAGSDATIKAGDDILVAGSSLKAVGSAKIEAGDDVNIVATQERSDSSFGKNTASATTHTGAEIQAGGSVSVTSGSGAGDHDLSIIGSGISAGGKVELKASDDITVAEVEDSSMLDASWKSGRTKNHGHFETETTVGSSISGGDGIATTSGGDTLVSASRLQAGNDGHSADLTMKAGGDLLIASGKDTTTTDVDSKKKGFLSKKSSHRESYDETTVASELGASGNVNLNADGNAVIAGSKVTAGGSLSVEGDSVSVIGAEEQHRLESSSKKSGLFAGSGDGFISLWGKEQKDKNQASEFNVASALTSGTDVTLKARETDVNVIGSTVKAGQDITLDAARDVNITPGAENSSASEQEKRSGFGIAYSSGDGGASIGIGYGKSVDKTAQSAETNATSTLSAGRDLTISAGRDANLQAATVEAERDVAIRAERDVNLLSAQDKSNYEHLHEEFFAGISLSVSTSLVSAADSVSGAAQKISNISDGYSAANAAFASLKAYDALDKIAKGGNVASGSLTVGFTYQKEKEAAQSSVPVLTDIRAGQSVTIEAVSGDLTSHGAQIAAGYDANGEVVASDDDKAGDITLKAGKDIILESAEATNSSSTSNTSAGARFGVSAGVGIKGVTAGLTGSASAAAGKSNADGTTQVNSHVNGTGDITLESGNDTRLAGAVVSGDTVTANVSGDLTILSVPDTGASSNHSASGGFSLGGGQLLSGVQIGGGSGSGETNWITEQSGLVSTGTMDVTVGGNTHLGAGKIISESGDLILDTGTLTYDNFEGRKGYEGFSVDLGIDLSSGKDENGNSTTNHTLEGSYQLDDTRQTVRATVGPGNIVIRDQQQQAALEQDGSSTRPLDELNRDPDKAYEITKDKHVDLDFYLSSNSLRAVGNGIKEAIEPGGFIDKYLLGKELTPEEIANIKSGLDALANGGSLGGCTQQQGFNLFNLIVSPAYAGDFSTDCTIRQRDGEIIHLGIKTYQDCQDAIYVYLNTIEAEKRSDILRNAGFAFVVDHPLDVESWVKNDWLRDAIRKLDGDDPNGANAKAYAQGQNAAALVGEQLLGERSKIWQDTSISWSVKIDRLEATGLDINTIIAMAMLGGAATGAGMFGSVAKLQDHYARHGNDFGAKSAAEYQAQAKGFLEGPPSPGILEKTRANGDIVRYNPATDEFGVVSIGGVIRTYYKPDPAVHGKGSNLDYFNAQ